MKVLIKPKITIAVAVKNKYLGVTAQLDKSNLNQLIVKMRDSKGRGKGIVGYIQRNGLFVQHNKYKGIPLIITPTIQIKIDLTLDLIFGKERTKILKMSNSYVDISKEK